MHKKTLQNLFSYRKREEVLVEIQSSWKLNDLFISLNEEQKEAFLDICTGQRGVKILFDSFFKEVFNPEYNPQTFCFASTSASKTVIPKTSITKTSDRFMSLFSLNTVQKNFMRFRIPTCIRFTRFPTQNWK